MERDGMSRENENFYRPIRDRVQQARISQNVLLELVVIIGTVVVKDLTLLFGCAYDRHGHCNRCLLSKCYSFASSFLS